MSGQKKSSVPSFAIEECEANSSSPVAQKYFCKGVVEMHSFLWRLISRSWPGQKLCIIKVSLATVCDSCLLSFLCGPLRRDWLRLCRPVLLSGRLNLMSPFAFVLQAKQVSFLQSLLYVICFGTQTIHKRPFTRLSRLIFILFHSWTENCRDAKWKLISSSLVLLNAVAM